ncbi:MAG: M48 family metallopeptidase [Planctomycetota bacterium]|nr:M48 family metallopeptidase [Planctomycetota bacterium]
MGALLPVLAALLVLQVFAARPVADAQSTVLAALLLVAGWALGVIGVGNWLARHGDRRALRAVERGGQLGGLAVFALLCWRWGWAAWAPGWTLALLPWVLMHASLWWGLAPAISRISGVPWTRRALVLHHLRFELAPVLLVLPIIDLCEWFGREFGTLAWFSGWQGLLLSLLGGWLLVLGLLAFLPLALLPLWGAQPLPPGELRRLLERDCAGIARLCLWRSAGGAVHNALAIGILPRLRWVLVSDDLLADLPAEQVRAVIGHELGHHRHGHLWLYLAFALCAMLANWLLLEWLAALGESLLAWWPELAALPEDWLAIAVLGVLLLGWIRGPFAALSRACERQADLAGAQLAGTTAMTSALQAVARLSGTPEDEPSWRHRSIRERVRFLRACARNAELAAAHHRLVARMRLAIVAFLAVCALFVASLLLDPVRAARQVADPVQELAAWSSEEPALARGLAAADHGDSGPLIAWLGAVDAGERQRLAWLQLGAIERLGGDDELWPLRHRLAALAVMRLGDASLELMVDNAWAYALVAGSAEPTAQDLAQARRLLPRLEQAAERLPPAAAHGLWDTIACIRFLERDWTRAAQAWERALAGLAADRRQDGRGREEHAALYERRLGAARTNAARQPGEALLPLPRLLRNPP